MDREIIRAIRSDLLSFGALVARDLDNISIENQPYIQRMAHVFSSIHRGDLNRLVFRAPPRHFKTKMMASAVAFELGHNPRTEVVWASYDEAIAAEAVDYVRDAIRLPWFIKLFPETQLNSEHARSGDFRTTKGGGLRAIGIHGKLAAKGIDYLVADDVLDVGDWNNQAEIEEVIKCLERIIPSRFNAAKHARAIIMGHLLNPQDPGSHFAAKGWQVEALAFEAPCDQKIELGHSVWHRKKGELLRPDAYTPDLVADIRRKVDPPYSDYYQQGLDPSSNIVIKASDFRMCKRGRHGSEPMVLSVDTALRSSSKHSYNVIQAWAFDGKNHFLREQFRERCSYEVLEEQFCHMAKKLRCYAAIIEETANGPGLIRCGQELGITVIAVQPTDPKANRLAVHAALIRQGRVHIARHLHAEFTDEVDNLPRNGSDQTDSCSQYLKLRPPVPIQRSTQNALILPATAHATQVRNVPPRSADGAALVLASSIGNLAPPQGSGWYTLRSSKIS